MVSARLMFRTYSTLGRALAAVPEPVALGIAAIVGDVLHQVRHEPRRNVERNLRRVVGRDLDQASLNRWSRRAFRAYARYWVEGARLPSTSRSEVLERFVVVDGFEHLVEAMAAGNGVVLALPHVGSWEYGGTYLAAVENRLAADRELSIPWPIPKATSLSAIWPPISTPRRRTICSALRSRRRTG